MNFEIKINETTPGDVEKIFSVQKEAFEEEEVAILAINLLKDPTAEPIISLMAYHQDRAVGHILFTRALMEEGSDDLSIHILAPLAIIPDYQNKGIGGMLIKEGLEHLKKLGTTTVFVLGHIEYYPKYGFVNDAQKFGFAPTYPISLEDKDAWMVQDLTGTGIPEIKGRVVCAKAMDKPEYWRE